MAQYLIANWDYTAEGNLELSFKEGDRIKLLEKHNDDWWEGELNDQIGFFPANRTIPLMKEAEEVEEEGLSKKSSASPISTRIKHTPSEALSSEHNIKTISPNNPYRQCSLLIPEAPKIESKENLLIDLSTAEDNLPQGWSYSYDPSGTIYFFNESTGESQWEKPQPNKYTNTLEPITLTDIVYDMNRLNLEALHPNWIRAQSAVQIKVSSDKMECSWKDYYAVLTTFGFVLTYKESLSNYSSKRSSSLKSIHLFGAIDLRSFEITPATKADTRKKFSLLLKDPLERLTVFISMPNESLYSEWSDSFMREKIAVQEERQSKEPDLVQISGSMPLYSKLLETRKQTVPRSSLEHNEGHENAKPGSSLSRWLSRSNKNNTKSQANSTATDASTVGEVFGGPLKLEKDGNVPLVVRLCIEQVEARGLDTVGIYRLSGQTTAIQKYKAQFNSCHEKIKLDQENDINVITGLLKLYFRELKNPLLTFENYDRLIEAARLQDYDERMFRLKSIIQILPLANYRVLKYLIKHLETVSLQSQVNKMEASNLALIFSMGLLRPKNDDISASVLQSDLASKVIECMITHAAWFFDHEVEDDEDSQSFNNHSQVI